ncbi:hypothetical protein ABMC88_18025 [Sulfitobacter sp. HNIBRBA2951]|uniref:M10 family metallopeptidase C-terminal domain-containing protein n=1 Tax=Sulfitobacter aquimarinus TaxID=3158557 RepID=UPI0032DE5E78
MSYFEHLYNVGGVQNVALSGLSDLQLVSTGNQRFLQATGAEAGQVFTWNVTGNNAVLVHNDILQNAVGLSAPVGMHADGNMVWVYGVAGQGAQGFSVAADGGLNAVHHVETGNGAITDMAGASVAGQMVALTVTRGATGVDVWRQNGSGDFAFVETQTVGMRGDGISVEMVQVGGRMFAVAASVFDHQISTYSVGNAGVLEPVSQVGALDGLGISQPTHLEVIEAGGTQFVLVGSYGTSSLTLLRLEAGGGLTPVHQVNDDLDTRFAGVSVMESIEVNGATYVVAGGHDDGLSLFTVLPEGRLLHLATVADTLVTGLDGPGSISLSARDGGIDMFVAESGTGILGAWRIDLDDNMIVSAGGGGAASNQSGSNLTAGAGQDVLMAGMGRDTLRGGDGADVFVIMADDGQGDRIMDFEMGVDRIDISSFEGFTGLSSMSFQTRNDGGVGIRLGEEEIRVYGANGADLNADDFALRDFIFSDRISVADAVQGPERNGTDGNDRILGSLSREMMYGGGGNDTLIAGAGNDTLNGGAGADVMQGGTGVDVVDYTGSTGSLRVDLLFSQLNTNIAIGDTYDSIENLIGSRGFDNLRGTFEANWIYGASNVDYIYGRRGDDTLDGGVGDDVLFGGVGADVLIGGSGRDRAQYSESPVSLVLDLALPERNTERAAGDTYDSIEDLAGGLAADHISGDGAANRLFGREREDRLEGRWGDDYLNGGAHSDTLIGGMGDDTMRGGSHADTFIFNAGDDVIEDFSAHFGDEIGFAAPGLPFATTTPAAQVMAQFATVQNGDVVFDFGSYGSLTLEGVGAVSDLEGQIFVF